MWYLFLIGVLFLYLLLFTLLRAAARPLPVTRSRGNGDAARRKWRRQFWNQVCDDAFDDPAKAAIFKF